THANTFGFSGSATGGALTSGGDPVVVTLSGNTYTGRAGGDTVFTLAVQPNGQYTFTQHGVLDHADKANPNDFITLSFGVTARDVEGGTVTGALSIKVIDDAPVAHNDTNSFSASTRGTDGNVVTGLKGGANAADNLSEDVPNKVTKISFGAQEVTVPSS